MYYCCFIMNNNEDIYYTITCTTMRKSEFGYEARDDIKAEKFV